MYQYKIYFFILPVFYLVYTLFTSTYYSKSLTRIEKNNIIINSETLEEKEENLSFIDKMIDKYAFFFNYKEKKYIRSTIFDSNKFFDLIDEKYLGKEIFPKNDKISTYFLVGKAFMTTYLDSTPNCLRIVNNSHEKYKYGFIYTEFSTKYEDIDILKIICAGILFHNISTDKKLELSEEDSLHLQKFKNIYCINDIINNLYSIIYENKKNLLRLRSILENNKTILYNI